MGESQVPRKSAPIDVEVGQAVLAEDPLHGLPQHGLFQRLEGEVPSAVGADEALHQHPHVASKRRRHHRHRLGATLLRSHLFQERVQGCLPRDLAEGLASRGSQHRHSDAVRVVQGLQARLAPSAMLAQVQRVLRVPLHLLGPALHHPDQDALRVGADPAQRRVVRVEALHQVLGKARRPLHHHLPLGNGAARKEDRSQPQAGALQ